MPAAQAQALERTQQQAPRPLLPRPKRLGRRRLLCPSPRCHCRHGSRRRVRRRESSKVPTRASSCRACSALPGGGTSRWSTCSPLTCRLSRWLTTTPPPHSTHRSRAAAAAAAARTARTARMAPLHPTVAERFGHRIQRVRGAGAAPTKSSTRCTRRRRPSGLGPYKRPWHGSRGKQMRSRSSWAGWRTRRTWCMRTSHSAGWVRVRRSSTTSTCRQKSCCTAGKRT